MCVCRDKLPTALASPSDHYLVIRERPGAGMPFVAFMSVRDAALAGGVPDDSFLMDSLAAGPPTITAVQAVSALGEACHGAVVRAIVDCLEREGSWPTTDAPTYASAYTGADVVAAIVEENEAGLWTYAFASEPMKCRRRVLLHAWERRGLSEERVYSSATAPEARAEQRVDVYAITPTCQEFSQRNHNRTPEAQARALASVDAALDYVRNASPRIVLVENVDSPDLRGHMDLMLLRLGRYVWRRAVIDPRDVGWYTARTRCYWVGVLDEDDEDE